MSVTASIIGAAGLAGAGISAFGANSAANTQADAANNAAQISRQNAIDSLNFQKQIYGNSLQMGAPGVAAGTGALSKLSYLLGIPGISGLSQSSVANGFQQPQQQNQPIPGGLINFLRNGGDLSSLSGVGNRNIGGPQLMQANGAQISNAGSAFVPNNPNNTINGTSPVNGGTLQSPGGPQSFGSPGGTSPLSGGGATVPLGGPMASGNPGGGAIQANGGGSAQVPFDPNGAGSTGSAASGGFGSLLQPYGKTFSSPTDVTEQNDPGYKFRIQQGLDALQNSAASRGGLLSGGTAKSLNDYAQNSASSEYGNVYNREFNNFQTGYNQYNNDQNNQFNRLASLAGMGQTSTGQLNSSGASAASNVGNILLGSAGQQGQDLNNAGAARASGIAGATNAAAGGINNLGQLALLNQLFGGGGSSAGLTGFANPQVGGFCWIAEELYGVDAPKTHAIRGWLKNEYSQTPIGKQFTDWYQANGERVAEKIKNDQPLREKFQRLFDMFASFAVPKSMEDFESVRYQR